MRVLMLSWEYPPHTVGGMGRHVAELSAALARQQIEVHIITPLLGGGLPEEQTADGVFVHRITAQPMAGYSYVAFVQQTNSALERYARALCDQLGSFELIHAHDWLTTSVAVALKHLWRRPLVATIHATERGRQQGNLTSGHSDQINNLEWWLTYEAWRVITCSRFMAEQVHAYFNTPTDKIDVVPNGVHIYSSPFLSEEERSIFRRRFAIADAPLIFYVGRIVYEKGLHLLINGWPQVLKVIPEARLVIAGTGDQFERVKQQTWDLHINDTIVFTGFISDMDRERFYHAADTAVFPSLYEPFGIVALEAMAATCPVVVASTGGLAEVVRLHETGIVVYPNDPDSLAWGILHTITHPEWASTRAANALREVRDHYNWQTTGQSTITVYERAILDWRRASWGAELVPRQ
ncbi:MAG: glycosyltransferase family 4 protein [Roseiflexaceae bacterium]|nr:glycosyltransferase family 4 protein [Roseiflexaceae bacterium]